jgi:hypothetical protein
MNSSKDMGELVKHIFSFLAPFFLSPIRGFFSSPHVANTGSKNKGHERIGEARKHTRHASPIVTESA